MATPAHGLGVRTTLGDFLHFQTDNSDIPDNDCAQVELDADQNPVLGLAGAGLARYDGSGWEAWNSGNSGLPDDHIRALAIDADGGIWLGTENAGLVRFGPADTASGWNAGPQVESLDMYPNPASDRIFVSPIPGSYGLLEMFDPSGRLCMSLELAAGSQPVVVSLPDLPSGLYQIRLIAVSSPKGLPLNSPLSNDPFSNDPGAGSSRSRASRGLEPIRRSSLLLMR
jgi:hypothetical protein